ncbi:MAG: Gfo/Idh/MocA family oxidoreductase [Vicinamibacterales bacterium]
MIGVGIIGFGYWGPNLVRNFYETPGCRVVSVSDLHADRLARVRARYPTVDTAADHRDLLTDPRIDLVAIATPVSTHFDLAMQALRMGKHVLIEKPMTGDVEQAMRLVDEADRRGLMLAVDHTFVYTGAVRKMQQLVSSGDLGDIYYYDSVRVNLGLFQHDVNVVWDLAVHDLSIMDYLLPAQPVAVSASGLGHVPGEPENIGYVTFHFDAPVMAHVHVNWLAPVKVRRTLIGGSRKMIVYDDLEPSEKIKVYDKGITVNGHGDGNGAAGNGQRYAMLVGYRTGDVWAPQLDGAEALGVETRHLVECITKQQKPIADGHAGLRVVRLLEAATRSMRESGRIVELSTSGVSA